MTAAATLSPTLGSPPAGNFGTTVEVASAATGYVPLIPVGTILQIFDPYWGPQEIVRLKVAANTTAIATGTVAIWNSLYVYTIAPNTALLGQPVAMASTAIPLNATLDQFAWFFIGGSFPVLAGASVAANTATGLTAAGTTGALAAGKQILNARVQVAATTTVVKANSNTLSGSTILRVSNTDGWFVGVYLSGTGIPATTTVTAIDASGTLVTMSLAATATGSVSVTATYNNATVFWNVLNASRPGAQGPIT